MKRALKNFEMYLKKEFFKFLMRERTVYTRSQFYNILNPTNY
jgi:hypothetical protein